MIETPTSTNTPSLRNRLDALQDWQFTLVLYLLRWAIILPLSALLSPLATSADSLRPANFDPLSFFFSLVLIDPAVETLIECTVPYWVMCAILGRRPRSTWPFVILSTLVMVALHAMTPLVILFTSITGSFLAFVYGHFASKSQWKAFLHTTAFHAGINIVGWTGMFL